MSLAKQTARAPDRSAAINDAAAQYHATAMSSSGSSAASSASSSPPASPQASFHGPPSLESLIGHFVAAKRSLTSTNHVWRANELVTSSRALIEELAVLNAKNSFARRGVDEQIDTLHAIRDGVSNAGEGAQGEFRVVVERLDKAHERLQTTLAWLRKTVVDASLRRGVSSGDAEERDEDEDAAEAESVSESADSSQPTAQRQRKTLYDFIDEANHEDLLNSLRQLIDSFTSARADLDADVARFDNELKAISSLLLSESTTLHSSSGITGPKDKRTIYDEPASSISNLFHGMEEHATEMATLLQSLVSHYDVCVTALKHTEGGGEAAKIAVEAQQVDGGLSVKNTMPGTEESLYDKTVPEPIAAGDKAEMLAVLQHDAEQVEDVVGELRDRSVEIEGLYAQLSQYVQRARGTNQKLREVLVLMHRMEDEALPSYVVAARKLSQSWEGIGAAMKARTEELVGLTAFHEKFAASYARLLQEVERRRAAEAQLERLAEKARREMERLWLADREAREEFMEEVGDFLPKDLYPALNDEGVRWDIRQA